MLNGWELENNRNTKNKVMVNFGGKKKLVNLDEITFENGKTILKVFEEQKDEINTLNEKINKLNIKLNNFIEIVKNGGGK